MAHVEPLVRAHRGRGERLVAGVRARSPELPLLVLLALWWLVPFAVLLIGHHGPWNGSNGLQVDDHMQYLAFIRESGNHVLMSNLFDVRSDPHLFFNPLFFPSGLAWKAGASLQLSFLLLQPLVLVVLFAGIAAYARRMFGEDKRARLVVIAMALFFVTPATPLAHWLGHDPRFQFGSLVMGLEMSPENYIWGGLPGALAVGLMPFYLLGIERVLEPARRRGRSSRWYGVAAGVAGGLAGWVHPWQGITLLLITGGLVAWGRFQRRYLALALPVALTAAPLAYFFVLSRTDSSWAFVSQPNQFPHVGAWLFAGLAPALLALPGFPGRDLDVQQRIVRIWPVAAVAMYFVLERGWFYHAFAGLSIPLAVLAVSGLRRYRIPAVAVAAICLALTVPGLAFLVDRLHDTRGLHFFAPGERQALTWLERDREPGAVLAPQELGVKVPGFTGRHTWVGHYTWTPAYGSRKDRAAALFAGRLGPGRARALVRESTARFPLASCSSRADMARLLGGMVTATRRFGCATVYRVRG